MLTVVPRILVVCGRNKKRSRTAEFLFKNDRRLHIRSVGLSPRSERRITADDITWADHVLVMEDSQAKRIRQDYREQELPLLEVLHIPDEYEFRDPELCEILTEKIETLLST